jgi:hypothetical protein
MKARYAITQHGKQVYDHWGRPVIFETQQEAESFIESPPPMVSDGFTASDGISFRRTNRAIEASRAPRGQGAVIN